MDKEVLSTIQYVEIFPVIALAIFFIFFIVMLVRVMRTNKAEQAMMASIPLSDGSVNTSIHNNSQDL